VFGIPDAGGFAPARRFNVFYGRTPIRCRDVIGSRGSFRKVR
jgi:hypothetical protein